MRQHRMRRSGPSQVVVGAMAIVFGLLFLLDNLDLLSTRHFLSLWPALIVVFGLLKIIDSRSPRGLFIGGAMVLLGIAMTLHQLGYIYLGWHTFWPALVILFGISMVMRSFSARRGEDPDCVRTETASDDRVLNATAVMGGFKRRVLSQDFKGGELTAILGGCEIDLREASITGEAVLHVFVTCGGISMRVPPDWEVVVHGTPILGGFDERTATPPDQSKRLIIQGYVIMGGVDIRN